VPLNLLNLPHPLQERGSNCRKTKNKIELTRRDDGCVKFAWALL
jgi:hypothetical protein